MPPPPGFYISDKEGILAEHPGELPIRFNFRVEYGLYFFYTVLFPEESQFGGIFPIGGCYIFPRAEEMEHLYHYLYIVRNNAGFQA